jgi:peptide deformylase
MILSLCYYGNPVLRKQASPVKEVTPEIQKFISDMIETMDDHNGIGLAATQVGVLLRIFVIRKEFIGDNGEFLKGVSQVFINPEVSEPSDDMEIMNEGCLSLPKIFVDVPRPQSIKIKALDIDGKPFEDTITGFTARQIMHENDHLNGKLIIDRCPPEQKKEVQHLLTQLKKNHKNRSKTRT